MKGRNFHYPLLGGHSLKHGARLHNRAEGLSLSVTNPNEAISLGCHKNAECGVRTADCGHAKCGVPKRGHAKCGLTKCGVSKCRHAKYGLPKK